MASKLTELKRPIVRRNGRLVVKITRDGLELRGYRKRTWRRVSWLRAASLLTCDDLPLLTKHEGDLGFRELWRAGALPTEAP